VEYYGTKDVMEESTSLPGAKKERRAVCRNAEGRYMCRIDDQTKDGVPIVALSVSIAKEDYSNTNLNMNGL